MLSICIPQYNFDTSKLVRALIEQGDVLGIPYEIIVIDDASTAVFEQHFTHLHVHFTQLSSNIGRSAIRNLLAMKAQYDYLLFMDGDSAVVDTQYLSRYVAVANGEQIVCGGRAYLPTIPDAAHRLRWLYGKSRECLTAFERQQYANNSFLSNNFLIHKNIFNTVRFEESLREYGHEDTLFGYQLAQHHIVIQHINNPLLHIDEETNVLFLQKTRQGLDNLFALHERLKDDDFSESVKLLRYFLKLQKLGLVASVARLFAFFKPIIEQNLLSAQPNLRWFDAYKLGYLCQLARK